MRLVVQLQRVTLLFGLAIVAFGLPSTTLAHGGGLDKNGCHTNRKTGDYHCHRSVEGASSKSPATPRRESTKTLPPTQVDSTCYTGPRGGRYRIVNGRKRYGC